jgi:UDP-N-acetyl-D-mannosaminuronic acid dehydrogenase
MKVTVIGAGGHVGLPFSLVVADAGHKVCGVDLNEELVLFLNDGNVPYIEHGAAELLAKHSKTENIFFTTDPSYIQESDVVAIMLGTPVDEENNPRLDDLFNFVDQTLMPNMKKDTLVLLRSTVSPGTTEILRDRIESITGWIEGKDFYLVFVPERVLQTKGIEETANLPALVGAFSEKSYLKACEFLITFIDNELFQLTPREAEIGKLMTNMFRYVTFALANEFWMIGEKQGVNMHRIIKAANYGYERNAIPLPGPNVGGPCLFKDGRFLLSDIPFADLIQTSFHINEGMPDYIFNRIREINPKIKTVLILGAAFKKDCDDTRNSLSFKMKKVCKKNGAAAYIWDPFVRTSDQDIKRFDTATEYDAVIVMTPHSGMDASWPLYKFRKECIVADIWKMYPESKLSSSGIYRVGDIR